MYARNTGDGSAIIPIREYDIAANTNISFGQVVKLSGGLVVAAAAGETGDILGVAAENHTGAADALNPRNNGSRVLVYSGEHTIFASRAPVITASGGSATTVTSTELGAFAADDFNGGYLVLVEKAEGSTNEDNLGTVKKITDYSYTSSGTLSTFSVASGGIANDGDKYAVYPPIGFAKGNFSADGQKYVLTGAANLKIKIAGSSIPDGKLLIEKA